MFAVACGFVGVLPALPVADGEQEPVLAGGDVVVWLGGFPPPVVAGLVPARALAVLLAEGDVDGLADLLGLAAELDAATQVAVDGLRDRGYAWSDIASRLGTMRQAVEQR